MTKKNPVLKRYAVAVVERKSHFYEVEAGSPKEAKEKANEMFNNSIPPKITETTDCFTEFLEEIKD